MVATAPTGEGDERYGDFSTMADLAVLELGLRFVRLPELDDVDEDPSGLAICGRGCGGGAATGGAVRCGAVVRRDGRRGERGVCFVRRCGQGRYGATQRGCLFLFRLPHTHGALSL